MLLTLLFLGIRNAWDLVTWMAPMVGQPFPSEVAKAQAASSERKPGDKPA
jgi:hypothetical protein